MPSRKKRAMPSRKRKAFTDKQKAFFSEQRGFGIRKTDASPLIAFRRLVDLRRWDTTSFDYSFAFYEVFGYYPWLDHQERFFNAPDFHWFRVNKSSSVHAEFARFVLSPSYEWVPKTFREQYKYLFHETPSDALCARWSSDKSATCSDLKGTTKFERPSSDQVFPTLDLNLSSAEYSESIGSKKRAASSHEHRAAAPRKFPKIHPTLEIAEPSEENNRAFLTPLEPPKTTSKSLTNSPEPRVYYPLLTAPRSQDQNFTSLVGQLDDLRSLLELTNERLDALEYGLSSIDIVANRTERKLSMVEGYVVALHSNRHSSSRLGIKRGTAGRVDDELSRKIGVARLCKKLGLLENGDLKGADGIEDGEALLESF